MMKEAPLQIGPCRPRTTRHKRTARSTSPPASNGKPISPTNLTPCKRVTRPVPHERPLPLAGPSWCTHRKITGIQEPALAGRMAQQPLSATYATEEMTRVDKRYPALAPPPMQPVCCTRACMPDQCHRQIRPQNQDIHLQRLRDPKVPVGRSRARAVFPQPAQTASRKLRRYGGAILKVIRYVMHAVSS